MEHRGIVRKAGFTLIELLIAATILFTALAIVADGYRSAVTASARSSDTASLLAPLPLVRAHIQDRVRTAAGERVSGTGELLGVTFEFSAETIQFAAPQPVFDPDSATMQYFEPRYRLYEVSLLLARGRTQEKLIYKELAWLPDVTVSVSR
jgi:type II secretory pathway pseudopilin PulG